MINKVNEKQCTMCGKVKSTDEFGMVNMSSYKSWCKTCELRQFTKSRMEMDTGVYIIEAPYSKDMRRVSNRLAFAGLVGPFDEIRISPISVLGNIKSEIWRENFEELTSMFGFSGAVSLLEVKRYYTFSGEEKREFYGQLPTDFKNDVLALQQESFTEYFYEYACKYECNPLRVCANDVLPGRCPKLPETVFKEYGFFDLPMFSKVDKTGIYCYEDCA